MLSYLLATFLISPEIKLVQKPEQNYGFEQSQGFAMQLKSDLHTFLFDYRQSMSESKSGNVSVNSRYREYSFWRNEFFTDHLFYGFGVGSSMKSVVTKFGELQSDDQGKYQLIFGPRFGFEKEIILPEDMKLLIALDSRFIFGQENQISGQPAVGIRLGLAY